MKKKFALVAIFLMTYLVFLIATLPITFVLSHVNLPKEVTLSGVQGTVWNTTIAQLSVEKTVINQVEARLSFWSLLTLTPQAKIHFGDPLLAGPEGQLLLSMSSTELVIEDLTLLIKANDVAQQLTLPLPVSAQGDLALNIKTASVNLQNNRCLTASGKGNWSNSAIIALEQNIKLGEFSADIGCEAGALAITIAPQNNLGLTFSAYVREMGKISGDGYLQPGEKFPTALNDALPFLGKKDSQGRYRLAF